MAHSLGKIIFLLPQLEAEINRLVFELYRLTEEEIALVEGKK
jgi:hypothetical protein